ncbi:MAG: RIP metalloprotease RseP [Cellvibrio sp.]|uniref:RIP metalloprotease RseP n=1 Tax=Cellvibrio sp. TaxID=1965322 RepID=UPI00271C8396|nr:RIP metalloprotease RseP [Cellvibrio sp.]
MMTVLAFLGALGLLITVHEYGHYRVAVACGVKVLRFSVGFGKTIFKWQPKGSDTEFVIGLLPLGGFVKMLDEREAPVDAAQKHLAFNTQPLIKRAAIVGAGPMANLMLAIVLYSVVNWLGVQEPKAILASPAAGSLAQRAGLVGGEHVLQAAFNGDILENMQSLEDFRWLITRGALNGHDVRVAVAQSPNSPSRELVLELTQLDVTEVDAQLFQKIGITGPWTQAVIGEIQHDSAAMRAGLRSGDVVLAVDDAVVVDGQQLRQLIRASVPQRGDQNHGVAKNWIVDRQGQRLNLKVVTDVKTEGAQQVGKIGAYVGAPPQLTTVRYGLFDGLLKGVVKTWDVSILTLRMMGRMLIGQASLKNLSGPLTIADFAGKSASLGLSAYLVFLALISVSLGVLNLLPLPVLDGGHLLYYLWESVTGKEVSDVWTERLQRGGVALLFCMMSIALFNDVTRIFVH